MFYEEDDELIKIERIIALKLYFHYTLMIQSEMCRSKVMTHSWSGRKVASSHCKWELTILTHVENVTYSSYSSTDNGQLFST